MIRDEWQQAGFYVHRSNCMELLADLLTEIVVDHPHPDPFRPETIVVNSRGMESWLRQWIARRGTARLACNLRFPFINAFVNELLPSPVAAAEAESGPADSGSDEFSRDILLWRIFRFLIELRSENSPLPADGPLLNYLADGHAVELRAFQLAGRIAGLFDHYQVYRPEMLRDWETGDGPVEDGISDWQRLLWRRLRGEGTTESRTERMLRFCRSEVTNPQPFDRLSRVAIFGVNTLPPLYLELFQALGQAVPVHLFWLSPSSQEIMYIMNDRERERAARRLSASGLSPEALDLYIGRGNRLLESWGGIGRDFLTVLAEQTELNGAEVFAEMRGETLLRTLQNDILLNRRVGQDELAGECRPLFRVSPADRSIQIHSCHTPLREVQILKDNLLRCFAEDPELQPRDILVMAPDISAYSPFIDAVFGERTGGQSPVIPYTIADRTLGRESPVVKTLLGLFSLHTRRFKASEILDLLNADAVRLNLGLSEEDVAELRRLVVAAGIRWGRDSEHRSTLGMPGFREGTWQRGIDRMLLGYAMESCDAAGTPRLLGENLVPVSGIDGETARLTGVLAAFFSRLNAFVELTTRVMSPSQWALLLKPFIDSFFVSDATTYADLRMLRTALDDLAAHSILGGADLPVGIDVVADYIRTRVGETACGQGFFRGRLTFCSMLPMRSIPVKVICLLGMQDSAFPRRDSSPGFDLMARHPRRGDRSRRQDDRYMFLEAVLSARDRLLIHYCGRSAAENTRQPPSVLVAELCDYIQQSFILPDGTPSIFDPGRVLPFPQTEHRLQPFNREYFDGADADLQSFSARDCDAARVLYGTPGYPSLLFPADAERHPETALPLAPDDQALLTDAEMLARFFRSPCAFLLEERLRVRMRDSGDTGPDDEVLQPDPLQRYQIDQMLLEHCLAGTDADFVFRLLSAQGMLPEGAEGRALFEQRLTRARQFLECSLGADLGEWSGHSVGELLVQEKERVALAPATVAAAAPVDGGQRALVLSGTTALLPGHIQVCWRYAELKPRDRLAAGIHHLMACLGLPGQAPQTLLISAGGSSGSAAAVRLFAPCSAASAREKLTILLGYYLYGLCLPLPFLPSVSFAFAEKLARDDDFTAALGAARGAWFGGPQHPAYDGVEDYVNNRFFGHGGPMAWQLFPRVAQDVFAVIQKLEEGDE